MPAHGIPGRCRLCARPIPAGTGGPVGDVCDAPACQTRLRMEQVGGAVQRRAETARTAEADALHRSRHAIAATAAAAGLDADTMVKAQVPHIDPPLGAPDPDQRARFVAHLDRIIAEAFAEEPIDPTPKRIFEEPEHAEPAVRDRIVAPEPPALTAACIACQGLCCRQARTTHAFLTERTLAHVRRTQPAMSASEVRAYYLDHLPDTVSPDSCVYHGVQGCTLPRDMRATVCSAWECPERKRLASRLEEAGGGGAIAVGLSETGGGVRVVTYLEGQGYSVRDDQLPDA